MYRRTNKYQNNVEHRAKQRIIQEQQFEPNTEDHSFTEPPELRRIIEITDLDSGTPVKHRMELYRTDRIDCYDVFVDNRLWKRRIGWSKILEGLRKSLPRQRAE